MKQLKLEDWKKMEGEQQEELEKHRKELKQIIEKVTSGDATQRAALEKAMIENDSTEGAHAGSDIATLEAKIRVHE